MSEARQELDVQYTMGWSQDLRDVTAKIRAIELFNPDGLLLFPPITLLRPCRPFCEPPALPRCLLASSPRSSYVDPHLLRRPRILRPACCLAPLRSLFFPSQRTFSVSPLSPLLTGARLYLFHPPSPLPPALPGPLALLSRRPCSRAVPLYLPPPVVPSSLKAVESNR